MLRLKVFLLLCVSTLFLNATNRDKDDSQNLKFKFEVIKHYPNTNYYLGKLTFENKGNTPISFWEKINNYEGLLGFTTGGWWFVHNSSYDWYSKFKTELPPQKDYESPVVVLPHKKVIKYVLFIIGNKKVFLKHSKNLRLCFTYYDSKNRFVSDSPHHDIMSDNIIDYNW